MKPQADEITAGVGAVTVCLAYLWWLLDPTASPRAQGLMAVGFVLSTAAMLWRSTR